MKTFNKAASAVLGALIWASTTAHAAETLVPVHHNPDQEMAHFLPKWKATMDIEACSKDKRKIHAAFRVYPAVNHLLKVAENLGDDKAAHRMLADTAHSDIKTMWQRLAARQTAKELTASPEQLRALPMYTELMHQTLEKIHRKTDISAFAQAIEVDDRGPC